jgi:uncharacterized cupredoxin-like copper-binding protein
LLVVVVVWLAGSLAAAGFAFASGETPRSGDEVLGPGRATVTLVIEHSRFEPARITVRPHTTLTLRVVNRDPITHELIIGDESIHALHEAGTHGVHGAVPGEVTVAPGEVGTTTYELHEPGVVLFACHLPGHFAYGMVGEVVVEDGSITE